MGQPREPLTRISPRITSATTIAKIPAPRMGATKYLRSTPMLNAAPIPYKTQFMFDTAKEFFSHPHNTVPLYFQPISRITAKGTTLLS